MAQKASPNDGGAKDEQCVGSNLGLPSVVDTPTVPDGGYGWVVCFASFMNILIIDGVILSFGVLLHPLSEMLNVDKAHVAWIGSIFFGLSFGGAPITCGLMNKFGCRPVGMVGGTIVSIALGSLYLANDYVYLLLAYGIVGGIGASFVFAPSTVVTSYYFESKRAIASGISMAGSGGKTYSIN